MPAVQHSGEFVAYATDDLRDFLAAIDRRVVELRSAVAAARVTPQDLEGDAAEARRHVASIWVAAQREADIIRARAESEARAIVDAAHRLASTAPVGRGDRPGWVRATVERASVDPRDD